MFYVLVTKTASGDLDAFYKYVAILASESGTNFRALAW